MTTPTNFDNLDIADIKSTQGAVCTGEYNATLTISVIKAKKAGNDDMLKFGFEIIEPISSEPTETHPAPQSGFVCDVIIAGEKSLDVNKKHFAKLLAAKNSTKFKDIIGQTFTVRALLELRKWNDEATGEPRFGNNIKALVVI
jgi:hypothetical protein